MPEIDNVCLVRVQVKNFHNYNVIFKMAAISVHFIIGTLFVKYKLHVWSIFYTRGEDYDYAYDFQNWHIYTRKGFIAARSCDMYNWRDVFFFVRLKQKLNNCNNRYFLARSSLIFHAYIICKWLSTDSHDWCSSECQS